LPTMLNIKDQLSILARLSKADQVIAEEETDLIMEIGKKHNLDEEEIQEVIDNPSKIGNLSNLPDDEKFEYLVMIIKLMKADRKIKRSEVQFCERIAVKMGYKPGVVADLSAHIYNDPNINPDYNMLKKLADKMQQDSENE